MLKVRKGGGEEITLVQDKEQRLHFAGAAVKTYPTPKVRETHHKHGMLKLKLVKPLDSFPWPQI